MVNRIIENLGGQRYQTYRHFREEALDDDHGLKAGGGQAPRLNSHLHWKEGFRGPF